MTEKEDPEPSIRSTLGKTLGGGKCPGEFSRDFSSRISPNTPSISPSPLRHAPNLGVPLQIMMDGGNRCQWAVGSSESHFRLRSLWDLAKNIRGSHFLWESSWVSNTKANSKVSVILTSTDLCWILQRSEKKKNHFSLLTVIIHNSLLVYILCVYVFIYYFTI
jgi:hypothetical protein